MDDLEITIVLRYSVPEKGLTFNGLLRGLERDRDELMRNIVQVILKALEEKAIEDYKEAEPERYLKDGRQPNQRKLMTLFGEVRYKLAQLYDREKGVIFCPLTRRLGIIPYRQYQREAMEAGIGQAVHLSYRLGASEVRRIRGHGPSKSTLYRWLQELAEDYGEWPSFKHRGFRFLMVDGTKVELQGQGGYSQGKREMRWALASEGVGRAFELVGFWVGKDWSSIRQDLQRRLEYRGLRVLLSDGGPGIEENLLSGHMAQQRCIWHGKRDFFFLLFQDRLKKRAQIPYRRLLEANPLFLLKQEELEQLEPADKPLVERLVRVIKRCFKDLMAALPPDRCPKTRTYLENFYHHALLFFDYWLKGKGWIPFTTNAIESAFSRLVNRVKRIGRRWSEPGLINWLKIAFRKILHPELWIKLWRQYFRINKTLNLTSLKVEYRWIQNAITLLWDKAI